MDTVRRALKADLTKNVSDKLDNLLVAVLDLVSEANALASRLDESRALPEKLIEKFAKVLAQRDAEQEETLFKNINELATLTVPSAATGLIEGTILKTGQVNEVRPTQSYASAIRSSRPMVKNKDENSKATDKIVKARSKSRSNKARAKIQAARSTEPF